MADWKRKGFVLDSDSDDASQDSATVDLLTTTNGRSNNDSQNVPKRPRNDLGRGNEEPEPDLYESLSARTDGIQPSSSGPNIDDRDEKVEFVSGEVIQKWRREVKPGSSPKTISPIGRLSVEHSPRPIVHYSSNTSSPLSEVPSSLPDLTDLLPASLGENDDENNLVAPDGPDGGAHLSEFWQSDDGAQNAAPVAQNFHKPGRKLRHRNAIQLHPYVIEKEKFNQAWRSRGLKPVNILQEEAARVQDQEEDSQFIELSHLRNVTTFAANHATEIPWSQPSSREDSTRGSVLDELPDVSALLQMKPADIAMTGYKRRKLNSKSRKSSERFPKRPKGFRLADANESEDDNPLVDETASFPSPSRNPSPSCRRFTEAPQFRVPPRVRSPALATLNTSSQSSMRQPRCSVRSADKSSSTGSPIESITHGKCCSVSSSDEGKVRNQLRHAQRRIKGVLPASWLKLDLMAKTRSTQRQSGNAPCSPPPIIREKRGVARPVARMSDKHSKSPFSPSDVSDASENGNLRVGGPNETTSDGEQDNSSFASQFEDASEKDPNDVRQLPVKRARVYADSFKSHRKKWGDFTDRRNHTSPEFGAFSTSKAIKPTPRSKKHCKNADDGPLLLSVLDFPPKQAFRSDVPPSFMKIAKRTARSRQNQGRHSPSRKYLRMATGEETEDLNRTIKDWREGTTHLTSISELRRRPPLQPRSANNALSFGSVRLPAPLSQSEVASRPNISVRNRPKRSRPRHLQSSFDYLIRRQARQPRPSLDSLKAPFPLLDQQRSRYRERKLSLGLQTLKDSRPAILESSQSMQNLPSLSGAFSNSLPISHNSDGNLDTSNPVLDRFFRSQDRTVALENENNIPPSECPQSYTWRRGQINTKRIRKRHPRQVESTTRVSCRVKSPATAENFGHEAIDLRLAENPNDNYFQGLGPFGARYSTNFDVTPLPHDVHFHPQTCLGSGIFARSITFQNNPNLDNPRGAISIASNHKVYQWGAWNEVVATELGEIFDQILYDLRSLTGWDISQSASKPMESVALLKSVVLYFSQHLSFLDPADRVSFLQRCKWLFSTFWSDNSKSVIALTEGSTLDNMRLPDRIRIATLGLVLATQIDRISEHRSVPSDLKDNIRSLVVKGVEQTLCLVRKGLGGFEQWQADFRERLRTSRLVQIDNTAIEAFVITHHVIRRVDIRSLDLLESVLPRQLPEDATVFTSREQLWQRCFTLLPFLEFDEQGKLDVDRRFKESTSGWNLVKRLISTVLEMYLRNPRGQSSNFNDYCRSLFSRCLHLINGWGWYGCELIIGLLFDFFAKNNLGHLRNEECHGSPFFLENLGEKPSLDPEPGDRSFHLLLKIIASGLRHMQTLYPSKKIRDLVWRLMPNHGRSLPKEQSIRQEDLDALRNHHDLLSTLYWASPPGFRPSLSAIRNLVDLEHSHREACHINIRTWFNLIKYQLSTNEPLEHILPFTDWHSEIQQQMLRQHDRARSEAEDQVRLAQCVNGLIFSRDILESTVAQNQRQIEAILDDALTCLELAVVAAGTWEAAGLLLSPTLAKLLNGPGNLANGVILKALDVMLAYARLCLKQLQQSNQRDDNDDSQDYGDWSAFNADEALGSEHIERASSPLIEMAGPLRTLLSNSFGADAMPSESLLKKIVDTWVAVGRILIEDGVKSYNDYLGMFGKDAWSTLRSTDQTRKYAPYFFSVFIETDARVFRSSRFPIVACWLGSLVEYETSLKFQHKLTSSLLNANLSDPLLINPPFWSNSLTGRFDITAIEFSDRRLSVISSVLSNMRTSLESAHLDKGTDQGQLQKEYKDLVKHMMTTMKHNYVELVHDSNARLHYVDFVQHVVGFLQEHITSICSVDRFFTDGGAFPSPKYDPQYVVGHLKNYGLRLSDPNTFKQLVVFLQAVSERSAAEGDQSHFVQQLCLAMSVSFINETVQSRLQEFMTKVIVPAYLQLAFECPIGWALAMPFLSACQQTFSGLHLGLDGSNLGAVDNVKTVITGFLSSIREAIGRLIDQSAFSETINVLATLKSCFQAVTVVLPTLEYVLRLTSHRVERFIFDHITFFKCFSMLVHAKAISQENVELATINTVEARCYPKDVKHEEAFDFTIRELRAKLQTNWTRVGDDYFVTGGSSKRQATIRIGTWNEEKDAFRLALHEFGTQLSALPALGGWTDWCDIARRGPEKIEDALLIF